MAEDLGKKRKLTEGQAGASTSAAPQLSLRPQNCQLSQTPGSSGRGLRSLFPTPRAGTKPRRPCSLPGAAISAPALPALSGGWSLKTWVMACLTFATHLLGAVCIAHLVVDVRDHLQRPAQR